MSEIREIKARFSQARIKEILNDYRIACESREASLIGRKEVFMGKAKFGIFGDGKEVAQIAMAKVFRDGDFRSGYYRDQTFMFAIGEATLQQYFAQLYAHTDVDAEPASAGRLMNGHFATRMLDERGRLRDLAHLKNSGGDISPTAGQIPRLVGLAYASKLFRQNPDLKQFSNLSTNGNEIAFGTIGNASTSEGMFLEMINAAGVLQIPILISVWDDGYGISVPNEFHTTKESISKALEGFRRTPTQKGLEIFTVKGWDYQGLLSTYQMAEKLCREEHVPVLIHVEEMTQPQGHSTSGSHERYKSKDRLAWEKELDCIRKMREWIEEEVLVLPEELDAIENEAKVTVREARERAWKAFTRDIQVDVDEVSALLQDAAEKSVHSHTLSEIRSELLLIRNPLRQDPVKAVKKALYLLRDEVGEFRTNLIEWLERANEKNRERYNSDLYSEGDESALLVERIDPVYGDSPVEVDGREVLNACFAAALERDPKIFAFGEDVGKIGDVNQGMAGLQARFGELRVSDTSIREMTIIGQGIGAALRGLRPIAEIQYLDYVVYALNTITDDLACLRYRTKGGQKAPMIIRTRGHRLEGVWHAGSPMSMLLGSMQGIYILVPRNMTQASGLYNTMFRSDDPAIMIECLNAYRLKEYLPENIGEFTVPLGVPEIIREGSDITIVTYGAMCRIVQDAAEELERLGISCEIIDVQTLLPFDRHHTIVESLKKTNRVVFADEDVPGGASAYMMQQVLELQNGYAYLDSKPATISAQPHRTSYGSDGDYFSKPNRETVIDTVYQIMHESDPGRFPAVY